MLVAGDASDVKEGDQVFCAYIGSRLENVKWSDKDPDDTEKTSTWSPQHITAKAKIDVETQIQILKGTSLCERIGDKPVTKEVVLQAIASLNDDCEGVLGKMVNVVKLQSANHNESKYYARQHYCEDERLSIGPTGSAFLALAVDLNTVPTLTPDALQTWIDFCASFLNVADYEPKGKAEKKAKDDLVERIKRLNLESKL